MTTPSPERAGGVPPGTAALVARSRRARNRLAEHDLRIVRQGSFRGSPAVLTRCLQPGCDWQGWFTGNEMTVDHDTTQERQVST